MEQPCCVWDFSTSLILCDRESWPSSPTFAFFLPPLAFANRQLRGEVTRHMLRSTVKIVIKNDWESPLKVVDYLTSFLETVTNDYDENVFASIHSLNFPHFHRFPSVSTPGTAPASGVVNPDVSFMLRCTRLRTLQLTFHGSTTKRPLEEFLDFFGLRPILQCEELKEVYLDGIIPSFGNVATLQTLEDFGFWIKEGFAAQGKLMKIFISKRSGPWRKDLKWNVLKTKEEVSRFR